MHFKFSGDGVNFPFHQDSIFRKPDSSYKNLYHSFVQTALAVDPATEENGCIIFFPRSHLAQKSLLSYRGEIADFNENNKEKLSELGESFSCVMNPGDLAIWNPFMVHGSHPNTSKISRRMYINGFVKSETSDRGMEISKNGKIQPLDLVSDLKWDEFESYAQYEEDESK